MKILGQILNLGEGIFRQLKKDIVLLVTNLLKEGRQFDLWLSGLSMI